MATKAEKSLLGKNLEKTSGGRVRYERFRRPLRFSLRYPFYCYNVYNDETNKYEKGFRSEEKAKKFDEKLNGKKNDN